jgi:regulator of sigma E protease
MAEAKKKLNIEKITVPDNRNFNSLSIGRRMLIIIAGVLMNFLLGWLVISIVLVIGLPQATVITQIFPNSPAEKIGLQVGDKIVDMTADSFVKFTNENRGKEITLKIERNGEMKEFFATPRVNPPTGEGALGIGLIEAGAPKQNIFSSIWEGLKTSVQIIQMVFSAIFNLISQLFTTGKVNLTQVAGPVGIVKITAQAGSLGFSYLLQLLALISFNLVVINIFPFPALDGGRLLFLLIEKIKGSPLPIKFERYANSAGMVILLLLMAAITIRDIVKF